MADRGFCWGPTGIPSAKNILWPAVSSLEGAGRSRGRSQTQPIELGKYPEMSK